ncbi:type I-E CRISPR-associated protein Cas7/Cse4/CasC [Streptomyces sp. NPDC020883]|uniref:type I-E CRISPR-associated protein Cas7/Cse4/CasC n=1 Tax=Streptomyces sp. NPDC020883 TaxID=3365099 RepID=UPI00379762FF
MNQYLCLHSLTTYTAVLLVRDANGRPKELPFGNAVRTLLTAQTERRADRMHLRERANRGEGPLAQYSFGTRTREWALLATRELVALGWDETSARTMAKEALAGLGLNFGNKDSNSDLTKVLIFAPERAGVDIATVLHDHRDQMQQWLALVTEEHGKAERNMKRAKNRKKSQSHDAEADTDEQVNIPALPTEVKQKLLTAFSPRDSIDIALYGRFLAEIAESPNVDGAIQTMGSFTVGPACVVDDFYCSADDAKLARRASALDVFDEPGAGMTGYQSLFSGTFYGHSVIDRVKLRRTLAASTDWNEQQVEAAAQAAEAAFIDAFCNAVPAAKANTTAAPGTLPKLVLAFSSNRPHNYAGCFEQAIEETSDSPSASIQAARRLLAQHHMIIRKCRIEPGRVLTYDLATEALLNELRSAGQLACGEVDTLDDFIKSDAHPAAEDRVKRVEVSV